MAEARAQTGKHTLPLRLNSLWQSSSSPWRKRTSTSTSTSKRTTTYEYVVCVLLSYMRCTYRSAGGSNGKSKQAHRLPINKGERLRGPRWDEEEEEEEDGGLRGCRGRLRCFHPTMPSSIDPPPTNGTERKGTLYCSAALYYYYGQHCIAKQQSAMLPAILKTTESKSLIFLPPFPHTLRVIPGGTRSRVVEHMEQPRLGLLGPTTHNAQVVDKWSTVIMVPRTPKEASLLPFSQCFIDKTIIQRLKGEHNNIILCEIRLTTAYAVVVDRCCCCCCCTRFDRSLLYIH